MGMTREEAIAYLNTLYMALAVFPNQQISLGNVDEMKESVSMAIKALEQEPCEDAISRQVVFDAMYELCDTRKTLNENPWRDNPHIDAITDVINKLPSVTPQPKTGHWIYTLEDWNKWECSECGFTKRTDVHVSIGYKYCPGCGARMIKEVKK